MTNANSQDPNPSPILFGSQGLRAGWGLLAFILLFLGISLAEQSLLARLHLPHHTAKETSPQTLFFSEGISFLAVLLATAILARTEHRPFTTYGLSGPKRIPRFLQGLLYGFLCLSLLVAMLSLGGFLHFDTRLLATPAALTYGLIWAAGFTVVAFLEETLLRGYVQYTLTRGLTAIYKSLFNTRHGHAMGFWTAAIILSFVFGLGHGSNPGESPLGLVAAGLAGLIFCLALYRTGSLWWALGFHASWDWAQSFLYGVADSGTMVQGHLFATHPTGTPILSGGLTGPEGSIFILPTLTIASAIILLTLPKATPPPPHTGSPADQAHSA